jgi:hypothetical protein
VGSRLHREAVRVGLLVGERAVCRHDAAELELDEVALARLAVPPELANALVSHQ